MIRITIDTMYHYQFRGRDLWEYSDDCPKMGPAMGHPDKYTGARLLAEIPEDEDEVIFETNSWPSRLFRVRAIEELLFLADDEIFCGDDFLMIDHGCKVKILEKIKDCTRWQLYFGTNESCCPDRYFFMNDFHDVENHIDEMGPPFSAIIAEELPDPNWSEMLPDLIKRTCEELDLPIPKIIIFEELSPEWEREEPLLSNETIISIFESVLQDNKDYSEVRRMFAELWPLVKKGK